MPHLTSGLPFVRFWACADCCLESYSASWSTQCFSKLYGCLRSAYRTHIIVLCQHQSRIGSRPCFSDGIVHVEKPEGYSVIEANVLLKDKQEKHYCQRLLAFQTVSAVNVNKNRTWNSSSSLGYLNRKVPSIDKRMKITAVSASLYHIANRWPQWFDAGFYYFNLTPSLPQPLKLPGWKMHGRAYGEYIFWSHNTSTFNAVLFDNNPFTCHCRQEDKKAWEFQILHFYWSFLSVIVTVKGLMCAFPELWHPQVMTLTSQYACFQVSNVTTEAPQTTTSAAHTSTAPVPGSYGR